MEEKKIIQKWKKSSQLRDPAPSILNLIKSSFKDDKGLESNEVILELVQKNFDSLVAILSASPFSKKNVFTVEDIVNSISQKVLRNLQMIFWMQKWKPKKISDRIDYELWQKKNFISAFFAEELKNILGEENNDDLFLQAYLNRISLPVISRTESKIFNRFNQINPLKQLEYSVQKEILGNTIGALNIFLLKKWGFPEEFLFPLSFCCPLGK